MAPDDSARYVGGSFLVAIGILSASLAVIFESGSTDQVIALLFAVSAAGLGLGDRSDAGGDR